MSRAGNNYDKLFRYIIVGDMGNHTLYIIT